MSMFVNGVEVFLTVPKEYSDNEMVDCLRQIKQQYGDELMTMLGCTCQVKNYIDKIVDIIIG